MKESKREAYDNNSNRNTAGFNQQTADFNVSLWISQVGVPPLAGRVRADDDNNSPVHHTDFFAPCQPMFPN